MQVDLNRKIAVVTGAAQGIGKAVATLFLENGAEVVIADIAEQTGQETANELSQIGACRFIRTDVSDQESVNSLLEAVVAELDRVDIFVNNAGLGTQGAERVNIDDFSEDKWDEIISVDLTGVFYCSRAAARVMIRQEGGRIINIGSVLGSIPARRQIAYVAAKAGVHNMTKAMALELAPNGILVNAVAPGSTLTAATKGLFYSDDAHQAEMRERMLSHVPLGRPGQVEDIANAVLFLAADESSYITGHVLTVDGGWTCGYSRDF